MGNLTEYTFGWAIERLKEGKKVRRVGWNGKGMWLQRFSDSKFCVIVDNELSAFSLKYGSYIDNIGIAINKKDYLPMENWIGMKTVQNTFIPWFPSQTDMISEDWRVIT